MEDELYKLGVAIRKKVVSGIFNDMDKEDMEEVLRILSPKNKEEREIAGIIYMEQIDGNGNKICYLDGGRGIRIKIAKMD